METIAPGKNSIYVRLEFHADNNGETDSNVTILHYLFHVKNIVKVTISEEEIDIYSFDSKTRFTEKQMSVNLRSQLFACIHKLLEEQ